ncbi:TPA: serine-type D-Ala-D-Ala carboxypeptidase, partial [Yersinia enterocolitica]|nr:serine-type D-Ala-D-Ala carboxypeptidase [Yersinia enterocolitica]
VGTIDFQLNGKTIDQRPLVVLNEVKEGGFFSRIWDFLMMKISQLFS